MGHNLAPPGSARILGHLKRFDARYWTVNFPQPMIASVVTTGPHSLRVDAVFYKADDLAGLIWEAEDRHDHPLLAYETSRDFRRCRLRFHWRSAGLRGLDEIDGPTLTIEGRDQNGQPRSCYVRLWNYAAGSPTDAAIDIDFDAVDGGFLLPEEADPVWAGDVDLMFVSLVPPGYTREDAPLPAAAEAWLELSGIACEGAGSVLRLARHRLERGRVPRRQPGRRRQESGRGTPAGDTNSFRRNDNRRRGARGAGVGDCDIKVTRSD